MIRAQKPRSKGIFCKGQVTWPPGMARPSPPPWPALVWSRISFCQRANVSGLEALLLQRIRANARGQTTFQSISGLTHAPGL